MLARSTADRIILQPKLTNLRELAIVPSWPFSSNITTPPARFFKFGLQLLPAPPAKPLRLTARDDDDDDRRVAVSSDTDDEDENGDTEKPGLKRKRLRKLTLGLPLDLATNAVSRQHLRLLRPKRLEITLLLHPHRDLFTELADLLEGNTEELCIRFLASDQTHELCNPREIVSDQLDRLGKVDIHLPALTSAMNRPYQGQQDRHTSFADHVVNLIALDEERRKRYTIWVERPVMPDGPMGPMGGLGAGWLKPKERVVWERQVDVADATERRDVLFVDDEYGGEEMEPGPSSTKQAKQPATRHMDRETQAAGGSGPEHWERETHLKLLGGLFSLRLESKKH